MRMRNDVHYCHPNPSQPTHSWLLKQNNCLAERVEIRTLRDHRDIVNGNHVLRRHCTQAVHIDAGGVVQCHHILLACICDQTTLVVIVEERIQAGAVTEDVVTVNNAKAKRLVADVLETRGEGGVIVRAVRRERFRCKGIVLHVASHIGQQGLATMEVPLTQSPIG